ncbi:MAG: FHA domain-containing protein [Planctomycetes bacterium]|nr:FHA domain-containing protein [Planctomycetota bacterium]
MEGEALHFYHVSGSLKGRIDKAAGEEITLGRAPDRHVRFDPERDILASARHARLVLEGRVYYLQDDGSTHGTFLNGEPVLVPRKLVTRDVIQCGRGGPKVKVYYDRDVKKCPVCGNPVYRRHIRCPVCERKVCLMCIDHQARACRDCAGA